MEQRPRWHPLLAAREVEPTHWIMVDTYEQPYGDIRLVRRGDEIGYRALNRDGELVGYYRTLRRAAADIHRWFLAEHAGHSKTGGYGSVR